MKHALKAALSVAFLLFAAFDVAGIIALLPGTKSAFASDGGAVKIGPAPSLSPGFGLQEIEDYPRQSALTGDFNGDGYPDLALVMQDYYPKDPYKYQEGDRDINLVISVLMSEIKDGKLIYRPQLVKSHLIEIKQNKKTGTRFYNWYYFNLSLEKKNKTMPIFCDHPLIRQIKECMGNSMVVFRHKRDGIYALFENRVWFIYVVNDKFEAFPTLYEFDEDDGDSIKPPEISD